MSQIDADAVQFSPGQYHEVFPMTVRAQLFMLDARMSRNPEVHLHVLHTLMNMAAYVRVPPEHRGAMVEVIGEANQLVQAMFKDKPALLNNWERNVRKALDFLTADQTGG